MQYSSIKPFRPVDSIIIPPNGVQGKNICLSIFPENGSFFDFYRLLGLKRAYVRNVHCPIITKPFAIRMTQGYRRSARSFKLVPSQSIFGDYSKLFGKNFFLDMSSYMNTVVERYKIRKFNTSRGIFNVGRILSAMNSIPSESFERVLLYSVNLDSAIPRNIRYRRIFPIWSMLVDYKNGKISELPFDKIILFTYNSTGSRYMLLFDKDKKLNLARIRTILISLRSNAQVDEIEQEMEFAKEETEKVLSTDMSGDLDEKQTKKIAKTASQYLEVDPSAIDDNKIDLATKALVYNATGSVSRTQTIVKHATVNDKKKIIKNFADTPITKQDAECSATNNLVKIAKPEDLVDNQIPKHILEKRKTDFHQNLKQDLTDAFGTLENKELPLQVKNVDIKLIKSTASELLPTLKDRYTFTLVDERGLEQEVYIELPHLTDNGTFMSNGQQKVLITQLVTYPIFFLAPYQGKFESAYSTLKIISKRLKNTSYLQIYIGNYKIPLTLFLSHRYGFEECMKMFGVKYSISDEKTSSALKLPDGRFITFHHKDEVGREIAESFRFSMNSFPDNFDLFNHESWQNAMENFTGNRNCIEVMNQIWLNIVTPIEVKILESKGDPTNIKDIVGYISREVVHGKVDDRNSCEKLRIRTSELFSALVQKQIHLAYNEYVSKRYGGDDDAKLYINPTKVYSEVIKSQNVGTMENINPIEELSVLTRITPIGIGGIPKSEAFPKAAMNIHPTYYGNIDPLETPDSEKCGIQQHLTVGANISNVRGMFIVKDRENIKPTEILSVGPCLVPFVESNEGARVAVAVGQQKQAIPLKNPEPPAVQTGYESLFTSLLSDNFIKKSPIKGTVESIEGNLIIIKGEGTEKHIIDIKPVMLKSGSGKNGLSIFTPTIKVGDNVKKDQIIAEGANVKDGIISNGVNMMCAFMPWKGYNFEDGMVISESAAKKFVSVHLEDHDTVISPEEDVSFIAKVGDDIPKGGILITYSSAIYDVESNKHIRAEGGKLVGIEIYSNVPEEEIPELLLGPYREFKEKYILLKGNYPIGRFHEGKDKFEGVKIKFHISQELSLTKGDKLNNRHFNKGVVSLVVPDENMPQCYDKKTEIFTKRGWIKFKDLNDHDEVAYIKDLDSFEAGFIKPISKYSKKYNGILYGAKNRRVDYLVTHNHRMYCKTKSEKFEGENKFSIKLAEDIHGKVIYHRTNANFDLGPRPLENILLENNTHSSGKLCLNEFNRKDFCDLMGWFISEGNLSCYKSKKKYKNRYSFSYRIQISQSKEKNKYNCIEIENLLNKMGLDWYYRGRQYTISNKSIYNYFKPLGKCKDKYIPEEIFNECNREELFILFNSLIKGDGSFLNNGYVYYTTSKRLAEDINRLATLLGFYPASPCIQTKNRKLKKYCIYIWKSPSQEVSVQKNNYYTKKYNDYIYCVEVPNGLILVRRNNKQFWCGNTPWGDTIDMIYNPLSVTNRMISGNILELHTGLLSKRLCELMLELPRDRFEILYFNVLSKIDGTEGKKYSKNMISKIKSLSEVGYRRLVDDAARNGFVPILCPPFKSPPRQSIVDTLRLVGRDTTTPLKINEADGSVINTKPVAVGYIYVQKLEHISEKKLHARGVGPYTGALHAPTAGKRREGGQKLGEHDMYSLLGWDCPKLIEEFFGPVSSDHVTKNQMISEIYQTGKTEFKRTETNSVKDAFGQMMTALHLEAK